MKTKELLREWKSFLNETSVVSLSQLRKEMLDSEAYTDDDVKLLEEFWRNPSHQFLSKYSQVIRNSITNQEPILHTLEDIKLHYHKLYQMASLETKRAIALGDISVEDLRKQLDKNSKFNSREVRQQCQYQNERPVVGSYQDFDVVYSNSDWIVIEPKTIQGSIAWAHGKPDGSEEKVMSRRVGWCTGVNTQNNMFPNYAGNLHMFYVISANYENDTSSNRKLCLSFVIVDGEAKLENKGGATVNARNQVIPESMLDTLKKEDFYKIILQRLKGRKETSFSEVYKKASLSQILRSLAQMKSQNIDKGIIESEIKSYITHTEDSEVLSYFYENPVGDVAKRETLNRLCKKDSGNNFNEVIEKVLNSNNMKDMSYVATNSYNQSLIDYFLNHNDINVKALIIDNMNVIKDKEHFKNGTLLKIIKELLAGDLSDSKKSFALVKCLSYINRGTLDVHMSNLSYENLKEILLNIGKNLGSEFGPNVRVFNMFNVIEKIKSSYREDFLTDIYLWFCFIRDNLLKGVNVKIYLKPILDEDNLPKTIIDELVELCVKLISNIKEESKKNGNIEELVAHIICNREITNSQYSQIIDAVSKSQHNDFTVELFSFAVKEKNNQLSLDLFNISNEKAKKRMSVIGEDILGEDCPEEILDFIRQSPMTTSRLFSSKTSNLNFEQFKQKALEVDFTDMAKDLENIEAIDNIDEYDYFLYEFPETFACEDNPVGMYNLLKSKGIDIKFDGSIFNTMFEDVMSWGYESLDGMFNYPEPGHYHFADLFQKRSTQNESIIRQYIRSVLSN